MPLGRNHPSTEVDFVSRRLRCENGSLHAAIVFFTCRDRRTRFGVPPVLIRDWPCKSISLVLGRTVQRLTHLSGLAMVSAARGRIADEFVANIAVRVWGALAGWRCVERTNAWRVLAFD